jgi:hypothetical protein
MYKSWCTTFVWKLSLNYASKFYFITLFDNLGNLGYPQDLSGLTFGLFKDLVFDSLQKN